MRIEKLSNGTYRVRQQSEGKRYCVTFDHKPTAKEINIAMAEKMSKFREFTKAGSLTQYSTMYIEMKEQEGKSPSTIRGYKSIIKNTPEWFKNTQLSKVTEKDYQNVVDDYYEDHSSKSTRNLYSFWHSILREYRPYFEITIKLPPKDKKHEYEPTTDDIKRILEHCKGTRYYLPLRLASMGLRRGEFCAITAKDVNNKNVLTINKDMVLNSDNEQVLKDTPKTEASNRRILIPAEIADMIREQGTVFNGNMHTINHYLHKCQDKLGIPRFRLHIMRHFAAALMLKNGFSRVQIEDFMGWEHGSQVMLRVYAYNLDPHDSQKDIASVFDSLAS